MGLMRASTSAGSAAGADSAMMLGMLESCGGDGRRRVEKGGRADLVSNGVGRVDGARWGGGGGKRSRTIRGVYRARGDKEGGDRIVAREVWARNNAGVGRGTGPHGPTWAHEESTRKRKSKRESDGQKNHPSSNRRGGGGTAQKGEKIGCVCCAYVGKAGTRSHRSPERGSIVGGRRGLLM
jgi:hypothetical protein